MGLISFPKALTFDLVLHLTSASRRETDRFLSLTSQWHPQLKVLFHFNKSAFLPGFKFIQCHPAYDQITQGDILFLIHLVYTLCISPFAVLSSHCRCGITFLLDFILPKSESKSVHIKLMLECFNLKYGYSSFSPVQYGKLHNPM